MNITVVGAGVIGCATAYELACRGARVTVVDPRGTGMGATRASAGILAPYIEGHSAPLLELGACSLGCYDAFVARVAADSGRAIEYRHSGTLQVAGSGHDARELEQTAERLARTNVPHSLLDGAGARRLEPQLASSVSTALLIPQHAHVAAGALTSALEAASVRRGVLFSGARASRIDCAGDRVRVATSAGDVTSDAVVIAAGTWSGQLALAAAPPVPVRPVRGQLLHLRFAAPPIEHVVWGTHAYLVPWQDGTVLAGATSEDVGFDESATVEGVRDLLDHAAALVPSTTGAQFHEVRVGLRPAMADELPVIGASSTMRGVYYATGHYRNGVLLAPLTALMLADLLLEGRERPELALVRPDRLGL